jgi:hypothetical protein
LSITLELPPHVEQSLRLQAKASGVSLADYVEQIVTRVAHAAPTASRNTPNNLVELFQHSPFKGLDMEFERDHI